MTATAAAHRPWLAQYPPGVPHEIDADAYANVAALLEASFKRFAAEPFSVCLGRWMSYRQLDERSATLGAWLQAQGWEKLLNRKGTMWRKLPAAVQAGVVDAASARAVMLDQPSTIKRPVVEWPGGAITVGFDEGDWAARC